MGRHEDVFNSDEFSGGDYGFMGTNRYGLDAYYLGTPSAALYRYAGRQGRGPFWVVQVLALFAVV